MDNGKTLRNADTWILEILWEVTQIIPFRMLFLTQKLWKIDKNSEISSFNEIHEFFEIPIMSKTEKKINALCFWPNFYSDH